jgi:hypothetical protein
MREATNMKIQSSKHLVAALAAVLVLIGVAPGFGQNTSDTNSLGNQLRSRYDIVSLRDGVGLVPRQPEADVRLIEVRNGLVAINGNPVSSREAREKLGQDADAVLRLTYLDAAAQKSLIRGDLAAASSQSETAESVEPEPPARGPRRRGDRVRFGSNVTVGRDEVVDGDVVAIGGSADVDGEVTGDVTAIGGNLTLGPHAIVRRDAAVIGGTMNRSPDARVYGKVDEVAVAPQIGSRLGRGFPAWTQMWRVGGLLGTVLRLSLLTLGVLAVVALGRRFVETVADHVAIEPLRAGFTGLLAEVLFVPMLVLTIVVLAVSIIGIPLLFLLPFAIVLAVVLMLIGFAGVACLAGRVIGDRLGIHHGPYVSALLGVLVIAAATLVSRIVALLGGMVFGTIIAGSLAALGYLAEYLAWTVGIGALVLTWLRTRHRASPPPSGTAPATNVAPAA